MAQLRCLLLLVLACKAHCLSRARTDGQSNLSGDFNKRDAMTENMDQSLLHSGMDKCDLSIPSQFIRMSWGAYGSQKGKRKVQAMLKAFDTASWSTGTLKGCGWAVEATGCPPPCLPTEQDGFVVMTNEKGNQAGVLPGACAVVFQGAGDDHDFKCKSDMDKDRQKYNENPGGWDPSDTEFLGFEMLGSVKVGMRKNDTIPEMQTIKQTPAWKAFTTKVAAGGCSEIYLTGHSRGSTLAQLFRVELGEVQAPLDPKAPVLTNKCMGYSCHVVLFAPDIVFHTIVPTIDGECNIAGKSSLRFGGLDAVPAGIPCMFGPDVSEFTKLYGAVAAATANFLGGIPKFVFQPSVTGLATVEPTGCTGQANGPFTGRPTTDLPGRAMLGTCTMDHQKPCYGFEHHPIYIMYQTDMTSETAVNSLRTDFYSSEDGYKLLTNAQTGLEHILPKTLDKCFSFYGSDCRLKSKRDSPCHYCESTYRAAATPPRGRGDLAQIISEEALAGVNGDFATK